MSRETRPRSAPHTSVSSPRTEARKIFNCIVDDTALVAGVKRSTRNGLRQWVKSGQIRLFVPLYALEQLNAQKAAASRHGEDVRETLEWLDQATSKSPDAIALQGPDEVFETWAKVEQFVVPRSLFSETDHDEESIHIGDSDRIETVTDTSQTSLHRQVGGNADGTADGACDVQQHGGMPMQLRPLFNYILWRIHQEKDPAAALESFIFLCNDPHKAHLAKGFEVRCKRLEQLRDTVGREERENRNRNIVQHRSSQSVEISSSPEPPSTPPTAPAAMLKSPARVIDPDAFERDPTSPRPSKSTPYNPQRGGRGGVRGRGGHNNPGIRSAANLATPNAARNRSLPHFSPVVDSEIDPNSFERPRGGYSGRGERKLWMPN